MKGIAISPIDATRVDRWEVNFRTDMEGIIEAVAVPLRDDQGPAMASRVAIPSDASLAYYTTDEQAAIILAYAQIAADRVAELLPGGVELRDSVSVVR